MSQLSDCWHRFPAPIFEHPTERGGVEDGGDRPATILAGNDGVGEFASSPRRELPTPAKWPL
jgi:hypothetical protein